MFFAIFGAGATEFVQANERQKPEVLIIVSHCLGYSELGWYGGEIKTPMVGDGQKPFTMILAGS
ncbi:MAG: hypothetical protein MI757_15490 [Pirellulales bacterium]|nr:hypothetical protein [Pirellulales bacterium]